MVRINEWLPNPQGSDAQGEWVEFLNAGRASIDLRGWSIQTGGGKNLSLAGHTISPGEYLVLKRSDTSLVLRNTNETLLLYDRGEILVDKSSFLGSAPEGKSFSRRDTGFVFADPTPGSDNGGSEIELIEDSHPFGKPLNGVPNSADFVALVLGASFLIAILVVLIIKRNENISHLFFG